MNLDYNMKMTQEQRLVLTQNMQQSIKLLQMSLHDLREYIDNEYSENPVLEVNEEISSYDDEQINRDVNIEDKYDHKKLVEELYSDNYKDRSEINYSNEEVSPLNFIEKKVSLKEYLQEQLIEADIDQYMLDICNYIVESLDYRGYLEISTGELAEELNIPEEIVNKALEVVQALEPYGIGARNIKECLLIQSLKLNILDDVIEKIILNHLENIAENKYETVAKDLNINPREAQRYGDLIKKLEPKPSRGFYTGEEVNYIIPDAEIKNVDGEFFILMNESVLPRLMINKTYRDVLRNNQDSETNTYVKEKINQALFLIKSIEQRKNTLYKVLECVVEKQNDFFKFGRQYIKPLTLKEVAEIINLHESTVSRAIKDKYVLTSYGTVKIKDLFASGLSSNNNEDMATSKIKNEIKKIIEEENKSKPLSDQLISSMLVEKNMNISRRTVAKYREELGIKSSSARKRL
ncbi:RNA polymerase factor sigma-54 [Clostridium beijerinckii]|jgi:RNA polymerase, sigma 54 subunit, RpoN/SigL|uniref:RNA polymerase factor sigma-54 n=2 Tax=Clostridium beijerinckii TaxID=1520 RepID=A0AAE2RQ13_CLOBE|nr:RNA polymerase factor sigma-54 [Clostridium beijerinckii]ABR32782.1 RNA polymerase, sigma 54 subunit, RpoN [Clostridium beijerinckii NCIMB 8052]AIU04058.1 RNA polymerase factor sigma-54 [Clostridium beijerinckii ATCC 35702]MBF7807539.1 RNA polymerase factor sigma-54 [Clostridium beijerinckii]NOW88160.1 RNA polymerase sigma-54 factor [Clostridium beijerinckii]NRT25982.1 RNA polymerase sigma-54 factor [Clostridium beijerinckii]